MTAPDRIWAYGFKNDMSENRQGEGWIHPLDAVQPNRDFTTEYIRKGAFPVEELREALDDRYGPETAVAFRAEYKLMERILSLLEGEQG